MAAAAGEPEVKCMYFESGHPVCLVSCSSDDSCAVYGWSDELTLAGVVGGMSCAESNYADALISLGGTVMGDNDSWTSVAVCNSVVEGCEAAAASKDSLTWAKVLVSGTAVEEHSVEPAAELGRIGTVETEAGLVAADVSHEGGLADSD